MSHRSSLDALYALFLSSNGITTDSRKVEKGELFVAIKGDRFDGNSYALKALELGASAAIVDDASLASHPHCYWVPDTVAFLGELAYHHRKKMPAKVILLTGTNGKTTTKELTAHVLSAQFRVHATKGNFNNHIGLPLTLLSLKPEHEYAVIEAGASHEGEIAYLSGIAAPDCGLITNIGRAHLEGFGSYEGVVRAKTELYDYIRSRDGVLFVHANDTLLMEHSKGVNRFLYATSPLSCMDEACIEKENLLACGLGIVANSTMELAFALQCQGHEEVVRTHLVGSYNMANALAAAAVAYWSGMKVDTIVEALSNYRPGNHRSQLLERSQYNNSVIADCYNANPSSMQQAYDAFLSCDWHGNRSVIWGDMLELGVESLMEHRRLEEMVWRANCGQLHSSTPQLFVGENFKQAAATLWPLTDSSLAGSPLQADVENDAVQLLFFENTNAVKAYLSACPIKETLVLVKASHGMHFEDLLSLL